MLTTMADLVDRARTGPPRTIAVACAHDEDVLIAVDRAARDGLVRPVLVGRAPAIEALARTHGLALPKAEVVDCPDESDAAEQAVRFVSSGRAQMLMKGLVATSVLLRAVLDKEWGLRSRPLLSHVAVFEAPDPVRLVLVTDVAMNIAPDLGQKVQIVENAVALAHRLGLTCPKVASVASVETVNPEMPATIDAALLAKMADRGQIKGCVLDGPLALDNALSAEAARHKGIVSPVAGSADVLLMPGIDAGNIFYKSLTQLTTIPMAAVIVGARAPVVLTSRADSDATKFHSIALAAAVA